MPVTRDGTLITPKSVCVASRNTARSSKPGAICAEVLRSSTGTAAAPVRAALPDGLGYVDGPILGIYLHGLFENPETLSAVLGAVPPRSLDRCFDELADALEAHIDVAALVKAAVES